MTPDEGLQHEWILEGNFNKARPRARPAAKADSSPSRDNSNELSFHKPTSKRPGKSRVGPGGGTEGNSSLLPSGVA